jgi:hypothetical protein
MATKQPFYIKREELSDGDVLWEVWQNGSDIRLASTTRRDRATELRDALNAACAQWSESAPTLNTIDV